MSTLVIWDALPGIYPEGLSNQDFNYVKYEVVPGQVVGDYIGDPADIASYGMTEFNYPQKPDIEIISASGPGVINADVSNLICQKGLLVNVIATNSGPAGTWTMPVKSPGGIKYATVSKAIGSSEMTVSFPDGFDDAGDWEITENLVNRDLPKELQFQFSGLKIKVVI